MTVMMDMQVKCHVLQYSAGNQSVKKMFNELAFLYHRLLHIFPATPLQVISFSSKTISQQTAGLVPGVFLCGKKI